MAVATRFCMQSTQISWIHGACRIAALRPRDLHKACRKQFEKAIWSYATHIYRKTCHRETTNWYRRTTYRTSRSFFFTSFASAQTIYNFPAICFIAASGRFLVFGHLVRCMSFIFWRQCWLDTTQKLTKARVLVVCILIELWLCEHQSWFISISALLDR